MSLGNPRPRNWGIEQQSAALSIACLCRRVAYEVRRGELWLAPSHKGLKLPGQSVAKLENVARGRWQALSLWDGSVLAQGCSERDVIRAAIEALWK